VNKFEGENVCICGLAEVLCPQITEKILSPQIAKSANCHICGKPENLTKMRFCELQNFLYLWSANPLASSKNDLYLYVLYDRDK
jgi:hypothetical protein